MINLIANENNLLNHIFFDIPIPIPMEMCSESFENFANLA